MATAQFNPFPRISMPPHAFRYHVSLHAVERYRERAKGDLSQLSQTEIAERMDRLIFEAVARGHARDVIDKDAPNETTKVVEVAPRMDTSERLHVVLRMHRPDHQKMFTGGGPACAALAAITVLTNDMAADSYTNGRWVTKEPAVRTLVSVTSKPVEDDGAAYEHDSSNADEELSGHGGTRKERTDFIRAQFKTNRNATWSEISDAMKVAFGVGASCHTVKKVRDEMAMEAKVTPANAAPKEPPVPPRTPLLDAISAASRDGWTAPTTAAPPSPPSTASAVAQIAAQFGLAVEQEKMAKNRVAEAERELTAALAVKESTSKQVTMLLEQLQAQRS